MLDLDAERWVIPRWRGSRDTIDRGELGPIDRSGRRFSTSADLVNSRVAAWREKLELGFASDAISSGLVLGHASLTTEAARSVLLESSNASPIAQQVASRVLNLPETFNPAAQPETNEGGVAIDNVRASVGELRRLLAQDPRNAIGWVDAARLYAILGINDKAGRAIDIALQLAPQSRFVLRAASRFFVHTRDPDRAVWMLRKSPRTQSDPWLLSAEIAISGMSSKASRLVRRSRSVIGDDAFSAFHVSELASAVATLELNAGNRRMASRYFARSLTAPTENSVAQARWAARRSNSVVVEHEHLLISNSFEARALDSFLSGDWQESVRHAQGWIGDEPFSHRPVLFASFVASSMLQDHSTAERLLRRALELDPAHPALLNNLAYALACTDRIAEAKAVFTEISTTPESASARTVRLATAGLLAFRSQQPDEGRRLYEAAIDAAKEGSLWYQRSLAITLLAREEVIAKTVAARGALERATREVDTHAELSLNQVLNQVLRLAGQPG